MKPEYRWKVLAGLAVAVACAALVWSQEQVSKSNEQLEQERQKAVEEARKLDQPGEFHKRLAGIAGEWTVSIKLPGAEPIAAGAQSRVTWVLANRFLIEDFEGIVSGERFRAFQILGYDVRKGQYMSIGMDTTTTRASYDFGTLDEASNAITFKRETKDDITRETVVQRSVVHLPQGDTYHWEIFQSRGDAPERKTLEIHYARKQ